MNIHQVKPIIVFLTFLNSLNGSSLKLTADLKDYIQTKFPLDQKHDLNNLETRLANKFSISLLTSSNSPNTTTPPTSSTQATSSSETSNQIVSSLGSHMDTKQQQSIAERARHEAHIIQRITQLRKEGLWSIKRLPKLVEPQRAKTHWDFLLDEMTWMSTDFQQERKWKKNSCKKLSIAIQKYFKDKELKAELAQREETKRMRKQASLIARDIMQFWRNVERIIEYKQRSLIEEKRKQAMDLHLNFIVDQTEKYSSWLIESLANQNNSLSSSQATTEVTAQDDYELESDVADDESTIEKEEQLEDQLAADDSTNDELKQLQMESEIPIEDLLRDYNLDDNYFSSAINKANKSELNCLLTTKSSGNSNCSMDVYEQD
jgi:E1A-binding protein p400